MVGEFTHPEAMPVRDALAVMYAGVEAHAFKFSEFFFVILCDKLRKFYGVEIWEGIAPKFLCRIEKALTIKERGNSFRHRSA